MFNAIERQSRHEPDPISLEGAYRLEIISSRSGFTRLIEMYEKRYDLVHVLSINRHHYGCVKLTMSINAPRTIRNCGVIYSIGESLSTN